MGQYYRLINVSRGEWVDSSAIAGAKLWEVCVNDGAGVLPYLLADSDGAGGGDKRFGSTVYVGRWAGDEVRLVGDYDSSGLYHEVEDAAEWTEITAGLVEEFDEFTGDVLGVGEHYQRHQEIMGESEVARR